MILHILFVFLCMLIDEALIIIFPSSFLATTISFVPALSFCAMLLTVRKFELVDAICFSLLFGLCYGLFFQVNLIIYALVFLLCTLLLHFWSKQVGFSFIESMMLCLIILFIKDFLIYIIMFTFQQTKMLLFDWLVNQFFMTMIANMIGLWFILFIIGIKDEYLERKALKIRQEEKISWHVFKQKD